MLLPLHCKSLVVVVALFSAAAANQNSSALLWATSGGGFCSLVASMGYAHAFYRAGLISDTSSKFNLWSSNSGGAWFQLQFLYSQEFFDRILAETPEQVGAFAVEWLTAFALGFAEATNSSSPHPGCATIIQLAALAPELAPLEVLCTEFAPLDWDYASLIQNMLEDTSSLYGDPSLSQRALSPENRVAAMQETDFYVQIALATNSRINTNKTVFLGPANELARDYALPLPMLYAVKDVEAFYAYAVDDVELPFRTLPTQSSDTINTTDWVDFYLFPPPSNAGQFSATQRDSLEGSGTFRRPFGAQEPSVAQIAAATSSASAQIAPSAPLLFVRGLSQLELLLQSTPNITTELVRIGLNILSEAYNDIWQTPLFNDFAICSQWPEDCGETDGRLIDGGNADYLSVAQTVGQYQMNGDNSKTLKIILTNNNNIMFGNQDFLEYFNTTTLADVNPGEFHWPVDSNGAYMYPTPRKSIQIFEEFMDDTMFLAAFEPIEGSNLTTAEYSATTVDNPEFKVQAGWNVEILLLQINSILPSVFDPAFIPNLAELAGSVAAHDELVRRIQEFANVQQDPVTDSPTSAPTMKEDTSSAFCPMLFPHVGYRFF